MVLLDTPISLESWPMLTLAVRRCMRAVAISQTGVMWAERQHNFNIVTVFKCQFNAVCYSIAY